MAERGDKPTQELAASVRDLAVLRAEVHELRELVKELVGRQSVDLGSVVIGGQEIVLEMRIRVQGQGE